jgi:uncharacterized protein (DUF2062 family)
MVSLGTLRTSLRQILHLDEPPHRTALAFAVGVFIAFSPTYGFHTLMVVFCAWAFRLNFLALAAGAFLNNPWTMVPFLGATLWTGFQLTGMPDFPSVYSDELSLASLYQHMMPYLLPFFLGGVVLSLIGGLLGYLVAYGVISHYRGRLRHARTARLPHETL